MAKKAKDFKLYTAKNTMLVNTMFPPSAFRVYNKVSEGNRYIPRQWTQEEFEAALPGRFHKGNKTSSCRKEIDIDLKESDSRNDENKLLSSPENIEYTVSQYPRKTSKMNEVNNLNTNSEDEQEDYWDQIMSTNTVNELESSKNSEATVKLSNEQSSETGSTVTTSNNGFISFLDACLQCLFNIDTIKNTVRHATLSSETYSSFDRGKLNDLLKIVSQPDKSNARNLWHLYSHDAFSQLYDKISTQSKSCDESLQFLLESLVDEIVDYGQENNNLRSVFQGKFCHAKICEQCDTVVREYESFMFLNPSLPPARKSTRKLNVNFLSIAAGVWCIKSHELSASSGRMVGDLKEELLKHPEFPNSLETSSIEIGEVKGSSLKEVFHDTRDLYDIRLEPTSSLFAFCVVSCQSEINNTSQSQQSCHTEVAKSKSCGFMHDIMSYHLYFNCGLCLNDGRELGLLVHRSCGGMVCRDCLDEISRSNQDWELCPCPVCERPINLAEEMCPTKMSAGTDRDQIHQSVAAACVVMFRTNGRRGDDNTRLFGNPVLLSLPQKTAGYHLYRSIGCLLPKNLPMKYKTSFTLHKVDKSGLNCGACSFASCTGCLVRIDDTIDIGPHVYLAVHFDNLTEDSKKDFGTMRHVTSNISKTQVLFDDILHSCVDTSSSTEILCPKCFHVVTKTISSISKFPKLLVIHLNRRYANQGLPANVSVADVARFFTVERENLSESLAGPGLTYQLKAAVLKEEGSSISPTYKSYVSELNAHNWLRHDDDDDEIQASEKDPNLLYLTCDGVLFYEPVFHPTTTASLPPQQTTTVGCRESKDAVDHFCRPMDVANLSHATGLDTITEDKTIQYSRKKIPDCKNADEILNNHRRVSKPWLNRCEPGEYHVENDIQLEQENRRFRDANGSQLSLGEVKSYVHSHKKIAANILDGIDTISPIYATDIGKPKSRLIRESKKLLNAVKMEDAYGIVCCLKKGADPCLLVDDVSALHLAAGVKSDQRRSMIAYLLKYSTDVNIATADGTTPMHVAAAWGHQDAVELLLAHGGDAFERTDIEGNSAFDLAVDDCSTYLQSVYNGEQNSTRFLEFPSSHDDGMKERRLEDIVRSNVALPSFVEEKGNNSRIHRRRWPQRLRSFRDRSTGILRNLRGLRRRSRIGVIVMETTKNTFQENKK